MKFHRKVQKLFGADGLHSAVEHVRRWTHPVDWKAAYRKIDPERLAQIQGRYLGPQRTEEIGDPAKFADAKYWLKVNIERAQDLDLDRTAPLRVLDLGCGAGYFLFVSRHLGHEAVGLDVDENSLYRETIALLGANRVVARVEARTPLPHFDRKFDLITAHCICFQKLPAWKDGGGAEWGAAEWRFFLDDVRAHLLAARGRLLLEFNPRPNGRHYPEDVEALFRQEGARIFRSKVLLGDGLARPAQTP